jgi:hypothetical protein
MAKKKPVISRRVAKAQEAVIKQKPIDINYKISDELGLLYSDQFVIQFYADEFVISFFQTEHPLVFSGEEFDKRETLDARCIARFVLNPNQMGKFVFAVNKNLQRWREVYVLQDEDATQGEVAK